ncbi:cyclins [Echinococcus multilocularis]|uniref:Cyclins n=1 Tax=Echinococcus multilocularis TaxID=6211 RepID=A0A068YME7_ECHMU|nr:cyclins [Echinococcus multilocularis]
MNLAVHSTPRTDCTKRPVDEYFQEEYSEISATSQSLLKYIQQIRFDDSFELGYSDPSFSYAITDQDENIVRDFKLCGLQQSGVSFSYRQMVYGALLRAQVTSDTSTEALHLAIAYADRYTWLQTTYPLGFESMAHGALWLAVKVLTPETPIIGPLMEVMTSERFTVEEIEDWAEQLRLILGPDLRYPTPHSYLDKFLAKCGDFPPCHIKLFTTISYYLLDLGLMEYDLARRPAYLRCAAVVYVLRRLLRCAGYVLGGSPSYHQYDMLDYWPMEVERYSRCKEDRDLYETALAYAKLMEEAKKYQYQGSQIPLILLPIVEKYMNWAYSRVAANPLVTNFDLDEVMCPNGAEEMTPLLREPK